MADENGVSAVEFALIAPVFLLIVAGGMDFGRALYTKFRLDNAISAASNYVLLNASNVSASGGTGLAQNLAAILATSGTPSATTSTVTVNNGPTATTVAGSTTTSGTAANADSCYCPSLSGNTIVWGSAVSCSSTCSGGAPAGKYVSIVVSQSFTPSFSNYGIVQNGAIASRAVIQAQ